MIDGKVNISLEGVELVESNGFPVIAYCDSTNNRLLAAVWY